MFCSTGCIHLGFLLLKQCILTRGQHKKNVPTAQIRTHTVRTDQTKAKAPYYDPADLVNKQSNHSKGVQLLRVYKSFFVLLAVVVVVFFCSFISPRSFDFVPRGIASPAFDCNCRAAVVHAVDRLLSTLVGRFYERCNRLPSSVSRCGRVNHKLSVRKAHTKERRNRRRDEEMGNGCFFFFEGGVGYS